MKNKELVSLVEQANKGSIDAFASLYNELAPSIYYVGLRMTGNQFDANDVVQETMVRIHQNLESLTKVNALRAFVSKTAANISIDMLRKQKDNTLSDEDSLEDMPENDVDFLPDEYVEIKEKRDFVIQKINELNDSYRTIITLFYYQQLSIKEISELLKINNSLTKTRLSRAREALKKLLKESGVREVTVMAVTLPVLTRIMNLDAKAAVSTNILKQNWVETAETLGYPEELVKSSSTKIGVPSTQDVPFIKPYTFPLAKTIIAAAVVTSLAVGSIYYSTVAKSSYKMDSYVNNNPNIEYATDTLAIPPQEGASSGVDIEPSSEYSEDNNYLEDLPPKSSTPHSTSATEAGATTSASTGGTGFSLNNYLIRYPAGHIADENEIIASVGVNAPAGSKVSVLHLDQVNFNIPNEYAVYIKIETPDGNILPLSAVIIDVQ